MSEKIQKILSSRGVTSRRHAEELIAAGRVSCNGTVCTLGDRADPDRDTILLDGKPIPAGSNRIYIMLNKPKGYVTTMSDEKGRKNISDLVRDCGHRVYPVGRLDMDSEGLLLMTNDGGFANLLMHPSHEVNKTYRVTVRNYSDAGLHALLRPISLDGYRIRPPQVTLIRNLADGTALLDIVIHEGRNRQVRRMCAIAGMPVKKLVRIQEGSLKLGDLPIGKWRHLTESEISALTK